MSTKRYCGTLELSITLKSDDSYSVRIRELNDDARFARLTDLHLSPATLLRLASDSSEAFDAVADAALGFASYSDDAIFSYADVRGDDRFVIRRRQR
jgi:hypothetical protein